MPVGDAAGLRLALQARTATAVGLEYLHALAQSFGARIVETTQARIMPPFLADNSGSCNTYVDARWLEDAELATLAAWVAGGMPEGDPAIPPPDPMHPPTLDPSEIATTLDIGEDWTPPTTSHGVPRRA